MREILQAALEAAKKAGAEYAEAKWSGNRRQEVVARDNVLAHMEETSESGLSVRVFLNGAWGQASSSEETADAAVSLARQAVETAGAGGSSGNAPLVLAPVTKQKLVWATHQEKDPFEVPLDEKSAMLLSVNEAAGRRPGISEVYSYMMFLSTRKLFASSIGSDLDQTVVISDAGYRAVAVGEGRFAVREFQGTPTQAGYEHVDSLPLLENTERITEEAVAQLTAKPHGGDSSDLLLMPSHTRLIIHETIGHALELDRVLGWEADYAGTSFATPGHLDTLKYGSPLLTVTADRTRPGGLATCACDDEGVPSGEWPLIREGILVDYATTRDTAPLIGRASSRGCAYAESWSSFPILRMPNVCIEPGDDDAPSLEELIADTKDGILVDGMDSFSIDHQRINFQFGGDFCRRIRKGKPAEVLWNTIYEGANPTFWRSLDAVCNKSEWRPFALYGCAKGQPVQTAGLTHGSAPLRLRNIKLGG